MAVNITRFQGPIDPGQTLKRGFSVQADAQRVLAVNAEVPVAYQYVNYFYDAASRPVIAEYFINGTRASYLYTVTLDLANALTSFFTIPLERNSGTYEIVFSLDNNPSTVVETAGRTRLLVPLVTGDTSTTIAQKIAAILNASANEILVGLEGDILTICNYFVGAVTSPDGGTAVTLSNFTNGTNGVSAALKRLIYTDATGNCLSSSEWVIFDV